MDSSVTLLGEGEKTAAGRPRVRMQRVKRMTGPYFDPKVWNDPNSREWNQVKQRFCFWEHDVSDLFRSKQQGTWPNDLVVDAILSDLPYGCYQGDPTDGEWSEELCQAGAHFFHSVGSDKLVVLLGCGTLNQTLTWTTALQSAGLTCLPSPIID